MGVGVIMIEVKRNDLVYMHSTVHDYARNRENSNLAKDFLTTKKSYWELFQMGWTG